MSTEPDLFQRFEDYLRYELDASPRTVSSYSRDLERYRRYAEERLAEPFTPSSTWCAAGSPPASMPGSKPPPWASTSPR